VKGRTIGSIRVFVIAAVSEERTCPMKRSILIALALAAVATAALPTLAEARYYRHRHYYGPGYYSGYSIAPYGYASPHYDTPYGRYPLYTYDPDPRLRAMLRSDFNRGVDTPGNR
jgi:hypothetical protein